MAFECSTAAGQFFFQPLCSTLRGDTYHRLWPSNAARLRGSFSASVQHSCGATHIIGWRFFV